MQLRARMAEPSVILIVGKTVSGMNYC